MVCPEIETALGDHVAKESILKFATDNKMNKDQVLAYVELEKNAAAQAVKDQEQLVTENRAKWHTELSEDKDFGGENFGKNIKRVDELMDKLMPEMKKELTDRDGMLPPYVMRGLLRVSKALNPTTNLVNGDPSKPIVEEKKGEFLDTMYE